MTNPKPDPKLDICWGCHHLIRTDRQGREFVEMPMGDCDDSDSIPHNELCEEARLFAEPDLRL